MPDRTLVVEDEPYRRDWFLFNLAQPRDITARADEAIAWLQERTYSFLCLDHDVGAGSPTGRTVSDWLIAHPQIQPALLIRVHSVNQISGPKIVRELVAAGRPAKLVSFDILAGLPALLSV